MSALIDKIFSTTQSEAIRKLWADESSRKELEKQIGLQLMKSNEIVDDLPVTQLMFLTSMASFASTQQECYDIAEIILWGMTKENILPSIVEHREEDLAYRCLLSLSFFKGALDKKYNRYGAPSPDFYRKIGVNTFIYLGKNDIGNHFCQWEHFMGEIFA